MGRSVSYASGARVITFKSFSFESYGECSGCHTSYSGWEYEQDNDEPAPRCPSCNKFVARLEPSTDFDSLIDDFRDHLTHLFPSVHSADDWIGREDHVLAENRLARFGMSEYCGLVSYWIVPRDLGIYDEQFALSNRWVDSVADKFVAAFGELTKVGCMSNGESVYRQIRN